MSKKIGLFGGTFDPVHNMHIDIAEVAIEQLGLYEVWFLADKSPRHKQDVTEYRHRLEMLNLASAHNKKLVTSGLNMQKTGVTQGIRTFRSLQKQYPSNDFVIISGLDSILYLERWESYEEYIKKCSFAVAKRLSHGLEDFYQMLDRLAKNDLNLKYYFIDICPSDTSSSSIRTNKIDDVHVDVAKYISANKLY